MQTLQPALFGLGFLCSQAKGEMMISCLWLFVYERWARSLHLYMALARLRIKTQKVCIRPGSLDEKAILQLDGQGR